jgi:hypothetical protein
VEQARPKPVTPRRPLALFVVPMALLGIAGYVGNAFAPTLLNEEPALLLMLAPRLRWLLLSSPNLEPLAFYGIPFVRGAAVLSLYFFFGMRYGETALQWMEDRAGRRSMRPLRWSERQFHKARWPLIILFPGTLAALFAGADRMRYTGFITVVMISTAVRLWLIRTLADAIEGTLLDILDWVGRNQLWLTVASFVLVFGWALWAQRSSAEPISSVEGIAEELDEAAAEIADGDPA